MNRRWLAISFSFVLLQAYVHEAPAQHRPGVEIYDDRGRLAASLGEAVHEALTIPASAVFAPTSLRAIPSSSTPCSSTHHRVGFNSYIFDCELGLYYTPSSRWYDPETGRFLQQDSYLGEVFNPPSLHRYTFGHNNPTSFVDPTGHESYRQWLGLDKPTPNLWYEASKEIGYRSFNFISLGALGRQDRLVEQYEQGRIGGGGYWLKSVGNAATSGVVLVAATASGGTAAGVAGGLGAGTTTSAVVGGATAGLTAQATTDVSEVALLGTKSLEDVSATDYAVAGTLGAVTAGALSRAGSTGANLNPTLPSLGALDNPVTSGLAGGIEATAQYSYQAGANAARAVVVAEGLGGNGVLVPATSAAPAASREPAINLIGNRARAVGARVQEVHSTLRERAQAIHGQFDPRAQTGRTTAVAILEDPTTGVRTRVYAVSGNRTAPGVRAEAAAGGEIRVTGPGGHAEQIITNYAERNGLRVRAVAPSRVACGPADANCAAVVRESGARLLNPKREQ